MPFEGEVVEGVVNLITNVRICKQPWVLSESCLPDFSVSIE